MKLINKQLLKEGPGWAKMVPEEGECPDGGGAVASQPGQRTGSPACAGALPDSRGHPDSCGVHRPAAAAALSAAGPLAAAGRRSLCCLHRLRFPGLAGLLTVAVAPALFSGSWAGQARTCGTPTT